MPLNPRVPIGTDVHNAICRLCERDVILVPTEYEYVLACNALDEESVAKLSSLQKKMSGSQIEILVPSLEKLRGCVREMPATLEKLACHFPSGRLTFLLPKRYAIPESLTVVAGKIAVSMTHHPLTLAVLEKLNFPLAVVRFTSHQTMGEGSGDYLDLLADGIGYVLDGGATVVGPGSTWLEMSGDSILVHRTGSVSREEIEKVGGLPTLMHLSPLTPARTAVTVSVTKTP